MQCCSGRRHVHLLYVRARNILVETEQIDLLLLVSAHDAGECLPNDGDDRLVVELRVVEAIEEVDGTRARCRHADTDLAGELGM